MLDMKMKFYVHQLLNVPAENASRRKVRANMAKLTVYIVVW